MINASVQQQQQQVDDKKATNANYNRISQPNLNSPYYGNSTNNRNVYSDSNYYVARDYQPSIDLSENHLLSTPQNTLTSTSDQLSIGPTTGLLVTESKNPPAALNEQISALFPKCRPRNDANLNKTNHYHTESTRTQLTSASNLLASSPSSVDYKNQNKLFTENESPDHSPIDNNRAYTRNMNSRNNSDNLFSGCSNDGIGIGEKNSSRRNNSGYGGRFNSTNYQRNGNNQQQQQHQHQHHQQQQQQQQQQASYQKNDFRKATSFDGANQQAKMHPKWDMQSNDIRNWTENGEIRENNFWEKRHRSPNTTPASTVLNSPDFNESHHYSHHPVQHQIKVGRSPVNQHEYNIDKSGASPDSPIHINYQRNKRPASFISDGEIVSFDEIGRYRSKNDKSIPVQVKQNQNQNQSINTSAEKYDRFDPLNSDCEYDDPHISNTNTFSTDNVTKMIGILPITEYEGSPRRFGSYQHEIPIQQYQYTSNTNQPQYDRPPSSRTILTSPTLFPPRPGFPKRVTTSPSNMSLNVMTDDEINKIDSVANCEYRTKPNRSSSNSSTEVTSSPVIATKSAIETGEISSPSNAQVLSIQTQNLPELPENENNVSNSDVTIAKTSPTYSTTFDYLYEFSETRKVLEDFFKCPTNDEEKKIVDSFNESDTGSFDNFNEIDNKESDANYVSQRLSRIPTNNKDFDNNSAYQSGRSSKICQSKANNYSNQQIIDEYENNDVELYLDSNSRSSGEIGDTELEMHQHRRYSRHFTLSPETTDYDSNCGDLDSLSNDLNGCIGINSHLGNTINSSSIISDYPRLYTSMPVLEDGLSSGHASDTENNNPVPYTASNVPVSSNNVVTSNSQANSIFDNKPAGGNLTNVSKMLTPTSVSSTAKSSNMNVCNTINLMDVVSATPNMDDVSLDGFGMGMAPAHDHQIPQQFKEEKSQIDSKSYLESELGSIFPNAASLTQLNTQHTSLNVAPHHDDRNEVVYASIKEMRTSMQSKSHPMLGQQEPQKCCNDENIQSKNADSNNSPIWLPRHHHNQLDQSHESLNSEHILSKPLSADDEEADTDLETDRLLGQQRLDDHGFYDDKNSTLTNWCDRPPRLIKSPTTMSSKTIQQQQQQQQHSQTFSSASIRQGIGSSSSSSGIAAAFTNISSNSTSSPSTNLSSNQQIPKNQNSNSQSDGGENVRSTSPNKLLQKSPTGSLCSKNEAEKSHSNKSRNKEGRYWEPAVLIEGVLFRARYLGSTQLVCEGQPTKSTRMMQAEEAVSRIKAPDGESQPSTEVDLFISTEKIMVLNTDLKEIMMDHALRTISYIADIGDLVVLMARRRFVPSDTDEAPKLNRTPKMICHVFESDEAQFIAQSIGQAFQVAYMEFLKANGIEDHSFVKEMDYQEVLNSQEIFGDELEIFAKKELQKEVVVPKTKGEILGMVIVESGWGSMLPTVVIANLLSTGAAARCGQLNIGDQIIAINGLSLVGLPLSTCQSYIRNTKTQTAVKFTVVPCPPVVEVKIKRPNTKYQLGFSVQNGVICSLLRGGIAERGGVRVGHRIIEINNQSVVAVPHEKIVNLLATSVGEILMKTMPTSMFRLLTGQENPVYI